MAKKKTTVVQVSGVPAADKAEWLRAARKEGLPLSIWIRQTIERAIAPKGKK